MKRVIQYIWQLPQNLLRLLVILFSREKKSCLTGLNKIEFYGTNKKFGVSLGKYIIVNKRAPEITIHHEDGHRKQSMMLGLLYLVVIGLPSAIGNLIHRKLKFDYYKQPWEAWADKLGGVKR